MIIPHKTVRNNYGDFYKNLMKPLGGKYVDKLTNALDGNKSKATNIIGKRGTSLSLYDANVPLQSKFRENENPIT